MSRTAGMGAQEYIAVNATAVAALILGLFSASAVLADVLLIVPVATVIVAIVAIMQVRNSGGTQAGTGLALVGTVLAIVFMGWVGGRVWMEKRAIKAEQGQIIALLDQLSANVTGGKFEATWDQLGPDYQAKLRKEQFVEAWRQMHTLPEFGPVKSIHWNGILNIRINKESGAKFADGMMLVDVPSGQSYRWTTIFKKHPDRGWLIEDIDSPAFFKYGPVDELSLPTPIIPR